MQKDDTPAGVAIDSTPLLAAAVELLRVARCPNCDGCGFTVRETGGCDMDGENDTRECVQEQCQWCFERNGLLAEYDTANAPDQARAGNPSPEAGCSALRRCEDCAEMPDDGTCDKCGDSILTTKDAFVPNTSGEGREV